MPAYDPTNIINQREKLPAPLRGLLDLIVPIDDLTGGFMPTPLVAGVPPHLIPVIKARGKQLIEKIKDVGLERRVMGLQPTRPVKNIGEILGLSGIREPMPNVPASKDVITALEAAQKRYPRVFGHLAEITDVDMHTQLTNPGTVGVNKGVPRTYSRLWMEGLPQEADPYKFSRLGLKAGGPMGTANTVGHELLHAADRIMDPIDLDQKYQFFSSLPGGYDANSMEIRARLMGEKFAERLKNRK